MPEQPLFPNSKEPRLEEITILLYPEFPETPTTYFTFTFWPNTSKVARLKVLDAEIENKFLTGLFSSTTSCCPNISLFFSSFWFVNIWSNSSEFIKVNFSANLLTKSTFSFSLYLISSEFISDLLSKWKSFGP